MTVATATFTAPRSGSRWLLLGSLALNLFFIGIAAAMFIRGPEPAPRWDPNVFVRVERLATTLPPADAQILRSAMDANHAAIAKSQDAFHNARDDIRGTLRQQPFQVDAMRAAMAKTRAARQAYDQVIGAVFANAAAKMSAAGRIALADWPHGGKPRSKSR
ncbi:MAG TPA: periplasmic heavy metal sensor [Pseudolabrys sp.]|nr:periplasmic heavy metal sensor [Pseudolabrys sp.]